MTPEVNSLTALKNLIVHALGQQESKRVKKNYYKYPIELDANLFYKRYRLRDDEDVQLIRSWHNRWTNIHLLELYVFFVDFGGRGSSADTVDDSPTSGIVRRTIKRTMVDLNMPPEGSQEGSNVKVRNVNLMDNGLESHNGSANRDPIMGGCVSLMLSWAYHRIPLVWPDGFDTGRFPLVEKYYKHLPKLFNSLLSCSLIIKAKILWLLVV
nr:uncharacterized protein LOC114925151 [Arachis hypogaea]